MASTGSLQFKIASENEEMEQIHRLNHRTFVEELPQRRPRAGGLLVDRYHDDNTYAICIDGNEVVGMIALAAESALATGYDLAVISGIVQQQKLYKHLGFVAFGPLVGTEDATFQPMYLTLEDFYQGSGAVVRSLEKRTTAQQLNFLPGPVEMHTEVKRALADAPESHRSDSFVADFQQVRELLRRDVSSRQVCIMLGSGTLANDAIAGQLSLLEEPGLVLSNGEFGWRLIDHATRAGLSFETLETTWGEAFDHQQLRRAMRRAPDLGWIWAVHCETSTGVLNRISTLRRECIESGIRLCLDCVSSIGTVPVDLRNVYLASGSSGKALGAYPGLAIVYSDHLLTCAAESLPRYLDIARVTGAHLDAPAGQSAERRQRPRRRTARAVPRLEFPAILNDLSPRRGGFGTSTATLEAPEGQRQNRQASQVDHQPDRPRGPPQPTAGFDLESHV